MFILYILLGLLSGIISGLIGIGGGIVIIPALIYFFGLSQHMAQGTTLALMVPPIGLLAALEYYRKGFVNLNIALFVCLGFFIGGYFGAKVATTITPQILKKIFGVGLFLISIKMILER